VLHHVVTFTWKPATGDAQIRHLCDGLAALATEIDVIESYLFGPDVALAEGNCDFALVAGFRDEAAYRTYTVHPAHRRLIAERIAPILATRTAVQFISTEG